MTLSKSLSRPLSKSPRSVMFVPASRPDRFAKALASGADAVVIDLEDAVAIDEKDTAREALRRFLEANPDSAVLVRINAAGTGAFADDLELCRRYAGISAIMVPKAQSIETLQLAAATGKPVWALIETALGIAEIPRLAAVKGVERFSFGALDTGLELGLKQGTDGAEKIFDKVRYDLVVHSKAAGLGAPIESVHPSIEDGEAVERMARQAREMGFAGMLCIHPRQLAFLHRGFSPDDKELAWAKKVLAAAAEGDGVLSVDGQMVDAPVIGRARMLLSQAGMPQLSDTQ